MKKVYIIAMFVVVLLISFLGITYSYEYNENDSLKFELIGSYKLYLDVYDEYKEYGVNIVRNGNDISSQVNIDSSSVNVNKVGEYKVRYEIDVDGNKEYIYRIVNVVDNVKPEIKLNGDYTIYLNLYGTYIEKGYEISDNYDSLDDIEVIVTSNLVVDTKGEYTIEYKVVDSSGNENVVVRNVIVK